MQTSLVFRLTLLLFALDMASAWAGEPSQIPDCGADPPCQSLYQRARKQSTSGQFDEALRLYALAYQVRQDPALLYSIARVLQKLDRRGEAVTYYGAFLASPLDDPEQKHKAREFLTQLGAVDAPLPAEPPTAASVASLVGEKPPLASSAWSSSAADKAPPRPLYKKWWFWTALGGAVVVTGAAITLGVLLGSPADAPLNGTPSAYHFHF